MANIRLAQIYQTSVAAIFDQFRIIGGSFQSLLLNRTLGLSWEEFRNLMIGQTVPLDSTLGISYDLFTAFDWLHLTAEEWYTLSGMPNFTASKAGLYLHVAGQPSDAFSVVDTFVIDMTNHVAFANNTLFISRSDPSGATGSGTMSTAGVYASTSPMPEADAPTISYPVTFAEDVFYNLNFRVMSTTGYPQFDVLIDGQVVASFTTASTADQFVWRTCKLLLPDREKHTLTIRPRNVGLHLDKLVIDKTGLVFSGSAAGPSYTPSPYVTAHVNLWQTDGSHLPSSPLHCYDAKNTATEIKTDDWYNFDTTSRIGDAITSSEFAVVMLVSGGSDSHFLSWDIARPSEGMPSAIYDGTIWVSQPQTNHALLLYSDITSPDDCAVNVRPVQQFNVWVRNFLPDNSSFVNTRLTDSEYDPDGQVVLDMPDKLVNLIVDQSGSNTWNDPQNARLTTVERLVHRLETYPGNVAYNLLTFNAVQVNPVVFASTQNLKGGNAAAIVENYFLQSANTQIAGVRLVRKLGSFPQTPIDGEVLKDGIFSRYRDEGLTEGTDYFYSVFTYNTRYARFSEARNIMASAKVRNVPVGISDFSALCLTGTGVVADADVAGCWHFDEGSGNYVYDFSDSSQTLTYSDTSASLQSIWIDKANVPIGFSGLRFNGTTECVRSLPSSACAVGNTFTIMGWVYWYGAGDGPLITRESGSAVNYYLSVDGSGKLNVRTAASPFAMSTGAIASNAWTHVAVSVDLNASQAKFYINGVLDSTKTLSSATTTSSAMRVTLASNFAGSSFFFGRMTEMSVHSVVRDLSYIAAAATGNTDVLQDNGDRIVTFRWLMDAASNGTVSIVQNPSRMPANPSDGTVVYEQALTAGEHAASHAERFRVGADFFYRIFVQNSLGNYSPMEDAAKASVAITPLTADLIPALTSPLATVTSFTATAADQKIALDWVYPSDIRVTGVAIYMDTEAPPVIDPFGAYSGERVDIKDRTETHLVVDQFEHNDLVNGQMYYFSIVTLTNFNQMSAVIHDHASPSADAGELLTPPPAVERLRYEPVSATSLELAWDNPIKFYDSAEVYIGDLAYMYGVLMDEYGNVLTGLPGHALTTKATLTYDNVQDVFGDGGSGTVTPRSYSVTSSVGDDGLVRGFVRFDNLDRAVNQLKTAEFLMTMKVSFTNPVSKENFQYASESKAKVVYKNPLEVTVVNLNSDMVLYRSRGSDGQITEELVQGAYARRNSPVVLRVSATYRGAPVAFLSLSTLIAREPEIGASSLDAPSLESATAAFIDITVPCPDAPQLMTFYARTAVAAFSRTNDIQLRFANPLFLEVTGKAPKNDGSDVAEQFAVAYYRDPNDPTIVSQIPNLTLVKWDIDQPTQPFYSTDATRQPNGVYSFLRNGTARKVFLGPVGNIPPAGLQASVTAKVVYDGLVAIDIAKVFILGAAEQVEFSGYRFLSELPDAINSLWADGSDYVKLTINHNPSITTTRFSPCFISCSGDVNNPIIPLTAGQLITITTSDAYEIIWGDVVELSGSDTGELDTTNALSSVGSAVVPLSSGTVTYVYFRLNRQVDDTSSRATLLIPKCDCSVWNGSPSIAASPVLLSTSVLLNGQTVSLRSGGASRASMPPVIIDPQEPLNIRAVDLRVDGFPSDVFVIDGVTSNVVVFEVSWKNNPVPNGTVVVLTDQNPFGNAPLNFEASTLTTTAALDPYLNPNGPVRSFVFAKVLPLTAPSSAGYRFKATTYYDASGKTARTNEALVSISYDSLYDPDQQSRVISQGCSKYTVGSDTWSSLPDMPHRRGALSLSYVGGNFYAIGGTNGRSITVLNEKFNGTSWSSVADMPTPRAYAQTVVVETKIYVIGGLTFEGATDTLIVSRAVECYDTNTNTWTTLASMPQIDLGAADLASYGVMMGAAVYNGGFIYILSGNRTTTDPNDRVLRYQITENTWTYSTAISQNIQTQLTDRLAPFSFLSGTSFHVIGGFSYDPSDGVCGLKRNAYSCTVGGSAQSVADSISTSDSAYRSFPLARYKGGSAQIGTNAYLLGGSSDDFATINLADKMDMSASPWGEQPIARLPEGLHSFGVATDGTDIFVAGGMCSGRDADFLQINLSIPQYLRLDGRKTQTMKVDIRDRNNVVPSNVQLLFATTAINASLQPTAPVPLLLTQPTLTVDGEVTTNVILPRSDDAIPGTSYNFALVKKFGGVGGGADDLPVPRPEIDTVTVLIDAIVRDTFYKGRTSRQDAVQPPITSGVFAFGKNVNLIGSRVKNTIDHGVFVPQMNESLPYNLLPAPMKAGASTLFTMYSDIPWVPYVTTVIGGNAGKASDVLAACEDLRLSVPFGSSSMLDAVEAGVILMQEDSSFGLSNVIYTLSDGEVNLDQTPLSTLLTDLQSLVGANAVPFIGIDMADQHPLLEGANRDGGNNSTMELLADQTGGQTISMINGSNLDGVVNDAVGRLMGAVGHGLFEYVVDILEVSPLVSLALEFVLPQNTSATWQYAFSDDDFLYGPYSHPLAADDTASFEELTMARYIKFRVAMTSGLTTLNTQSGETIGTESPALDAINIVFNKSLTQYLFLNPRDTTGKPEDVVLAVDANKADETELRVGVSTCDNYNWERFDTRPSPAQENNGKMVIPYRIYQPADTKHEKLIPLDGFMLVAQYGRWQPNSVVSVFDSTGAEVDSDKYNVNPDSGTVVFKDRIDDTPYYLSLTEAKTLKMAVQVVSRSGTVPTTIYGAGAMYTQR